MPLAAQASPLGRWQPPMKFTGTLPGCAGNQGERFYSIHCSLIPVGPHRGKLLVWDKSEAVTCSVYNGQWSGDRDQRWAIVDPEGPTSLPPRPLITHIDAWTIPAAFAPPVYRHFPGLPNITSGGQGLFCAGHCWLPDGRLLVVGGNDWHSKHTGSYAAFTGARLVSVYDPTQPPNGNGTWSTLKQIHPSEPFLVEARWYPTVVLANDPLQSFRSVKAIVLGGIEEFTPGAPDELPAPTNGFFLATDRAYLTHEAYDIAEVAPGQPWAISKDARQGGALPANYTPNAPIPGRFRGHSTPTSVSMPDFQLGLSLFYYARAHYLSNGVLGGATVSNGIVWSAGMAIDTAWIDHPTNPNVWGPHIPEIVPGAPFHMLEEPTAVLLPASLGAGGEDRIAVIGGQYGSEHTGTITNEVFVLDARATVPAFTTSAIPPMHHARKFANSVLLPDRSLLVLGGGTNAGHGLPGGEVFVPEVFRGSVWEECEAEDSPRTYHSAALLLPSGNVVTIGGDSSTWDLQVFEPHYCTPLATRPVIQTVPTTVGYNTTIAVAFTLSSGRTLASASLIAPGSVTHSHDPNQRIVELGIVTSTATTATLSTPANPTKAPFGHYMLFLVDSAGEVSIAAWTQLL